MDALDFLKNELNHRLDKQWKIFSWVSTVLIGISGGMITLEAKKDKAFDINAPERLVLSAIIATLAFYAITWVNQNIRIEEILRKELASKLDLPKNIPLSPGVMNIGYSLALLILAIAAVISVWIKYPWC